MGTVGDSGRGRVIDDEACIGQELMRQIRSASLGEFADRVLYCQRVLQDAGGCGRVGPSCQRNIKQGLEPLAQQIPGGRCGPLVGILG